ncbi:hypothetical protein OS493_037015 [Desmophyllum pertusum]|uniref:Uncharacterized protein n=1 Tax=Desmophyllum pertusum TaxID=174260 RepID=A0A9X0CJ36_9CNID|nr:hypothetical protein OS493_037015 [Desmophyllum pertusum]
MSKKQSSASMKAKLTTELTDEEKAKQEETKKAKEAEKVEAEKKRNAGIAARIAQATKRISSQHQQNDNPHQSNEFQEGDNVHPLSLPAFRTLFFLLHQTTNNLPKDKTKKTHTAMPDASTRRPPASNKPASGRKQIINTHPVNVVSDDELESDEAVITTSCDNADCQALLQENNNLKTEFTRGPGRGDTSNLSVLAETWPD